MSDTQVFQHIAEFYNRITAKGRNKVAYFYDLSHVTELSLIPPKRDFTYSRLPWLDGQ